MRIMAIILFSIFMLGTLANAETLQCMSKKGEHIYYGGDGQIVLTASVISSELLHNVNFTLVPENKYGSREPGPAQGRVRGGFVKFSLYGDAWCEYRISIPKDFRLRTNGKFPLFLDAYCEEHTNSNHRLNCKLTNP